MIDAIKTRLSTTVNFPSPPAIAQQIIALASEPDVDIALVAAAISKDPGLTAKILRVANSPLYSKRRKSENLRQALVVLGLNAATTLALSFSLVGTYNGGKGSGIDYARYWRRAILGASAARAFGGLRPGVSLDDIFLAALLQDIAVLAIDRVKPDFYAGLPADASHAQQSAYERKALGSDHAELGAWLMRQWKLPEPLCLVVESSHQPVRIDRSKPSGFAARCAALGGDCADVLWSTDRDADLKRLAEHAQSWLGIAPAVLAKTMGDIVAEVPEIERLFDTSLLDAESAAFIMEQARELLTIRNLQALEQVSTLKETSENLEARTVALEDKQRRDTLTGLFNRGYLDEVLEKEYRSASVGGWPLSVVFADLDRFKLVNDTYGHPAGDKVLIGAARLILEAVRDSDFVARYGGEEFVIVLPGMETEGAEVVCERLLRKLRDARHSVPGAVIRATASLGLATHGPNSPFASVSHLIDAADRAVYSAKKAGRDQLVRFDAGGVRRTA